MHRWDTVAIVGVGLIGGSIGLALRERKLARRVVGIGRSAGSLARAVACGCVSETATSIAQGVSGANLVVVGTPVDHIADHVAEAAACCGPETLLTDAGSTKAHIVTAAEAALLALENHEPIDLTGGLSMISAEAALLPREGEASSGLRFVGSHPIAGGEKTGPEAARADLFEERVCVVTPTQRTSAAALSQIEAFWQSLGMRVLRMSPADHDAVLARTSHLPHLVASALAAATPADTLPLTASGWGDTTRVAAGDVELWRQIFLANRAGTLLALTDFETVLKAFRAALETADGTHLAELLAEGKRRRDAVGS